MLHWLKQQLKKEQDFLHAQKPIILTIHGYGRRRKHEFDNFVRWGAQDGFEIIQFDMYDLFDAQDHDWMQWISRAKEAVDAYKQSGRDIYLVGFSMGGVIASYLSVVCPIKRLILLAPAFNYINMDLITGAISKSASNLMGSEKKEDIQLPRSFYSAFTDCIKNLKKYIGFVECPVCILHGDMDEVISVKSSVWAYNKIPHTQKKLLLLHEGHHRLLMDENVSWVCYQNMKLFLQGILIPDEPPEMAEDILPSLIEEKKRRDTMDLSSIEAEDALKESKHQDETF